MPLVFASTGSPGRIADIHIDLIESISAPRSYDRTNVALEVGVPVTNHRQRVPFTLSIVVVISDVEPVAGSTLLGFWEKNHAKKTRDAIRLLQAKGTEVTFFDGREIWRTPSGSRVWVIDEIDEGKSAAENGLILQTWRATITLGEVGRFSTAFTTIDPELDDSLTDSLDGVVDKGQQSTETVPADLAATIPG